MSSSKTLDLIENQIEKEQKLMTVHKTNGKYADTEICRLKIQQLQKDHQARSLYEMKLRHKQQQQNLIESNHKEHASFNEFWNKQEAQIKQNEEKNENEMIERHKIELVQTKKGLEIINSPKVKESSQLLNLRRMEEHMVKQKDFSQAHKVQAKIFEMQKVQKKTWLDKRDEKIDTALNTLKGKQNLEFNNLKAKYKALLDESRTNRQLEVEKLLLKHNNLLKDLKSQQEKQFLNYKGQFRSKGGKDSPMRTKSSLHS